MSSKAPLPLLRYRKLRTPSLATKIQAQSSPSISLVVHPGCAAAPPASTHSSLGRHLTEGPAAMVAKQLIAAIARDVDIQVAVVVVVAHRHAGSEHPIACYTRLSCYILEFPVAHVA